MPFTLSHPAAVLPIHARLKEWLRLAPLVVGSMVPDMAYYLPVPDHFRRSAHSLLGTFTSSLPLGILLLLVVYWIGEETVFLLPRPHCEALRGRLKVPAARLRETLLAVLGVTTGAWTHLLWDSFTHQGSWIVRRVPLLRESLLGSRMHSYDVLQNVSSVAGLCVLLYAYNKWLRSNGFRLWTWEKPSWRLYLWLGVGMASLGAAAVESHAVHAVLNLFFLHHAWHWALILVTGFLRDIFIATGLLAIGVKVLGLCRSAQAQPATISQPPASFR